MKERGGRERREVEERGGREVEGSGGERWEEVEEGSEGERWEGGRGKWRREVGGR